MSFKLSFLPLMNTCILIFILFTLRKSLATDEHFRICNVTRNCGYLNINFPFFIDESRCGYPGFNISCKNNTNRIFSLPDNGDYIIHNIFYENRSIHISKAHPFDADDVSNNSIRNISILEDRFYVSPDQSNMSLFFDCISASDLPRFLGPYKVVCDVEYGTNVTLSLDSDDDMLGYASQYCNKTVQLLADYSGNETGFGGILNQGFILKWKSSNCSVDGVSGGKCGFDDSMNNSKFFCLGRPHASSCTHGMFFWRSNQ